ncbi:MAG: hypothetical protein WAN89_06025 [Lawsonella sp.]|nr:hypothetical protein [Mycobacteriales bacterium]
MKKVVELLGATLIALALAITPTSSTAAAAPAANTSADSIVITPITNLWRITGERNGKKVGVLCNAGYLFEKNNTVYGLTSEGCGERGDLFIITPNDTVQHVGRIVAKDANKTSFMTVIEFNSNVQMGPSPQALPTGLQARPFVNTVVYRVTDNTWLKLPLLLTGVRDDQYGVSSFDFSCDTQKVIPGSVVLAQNPTGPFLGIFTGYHKFSGNRLGICYGIANSYLEDFAQSGKWDSTL